jgi:hypothetical protein
MKNENPFEQQKQWYSGAGEGKAHPTSPRVLHPFGHPCHRNGKKVIRHEIQIHEQTAMSLRPDLR